MKSKYIKYILVVVLQIVVVLAIVIYKVSIVGSGTDVLLKIEPVDPCDPLRGDYVTFQYEISEIDSHYMDYDQEFKSGDSVYVILQKDDKYWDIKNVQKDKPEVGEICIKGRVKRSRWGGMSGSILVSYGVEEYFIPEGTGRNFSFWNKEASATVAVDKNCNAVLKQLYIDDKPWP